MRNSMLIAALFALASACAHEQVKSVKDVEAKPVAQPVAPPPEATPAQVYAQAKEKIGAKDWASARLALESFLKKEPGSAAAHFDAGYVAEQTGDAAEARKQYKAALDAEPAHLGAALNLTRLLKVDQRYDEAASLLTAALSKRDDDPVLLNALAGVLRLQKKYDDAEKSVQKVLLRNPGDAGAYKNLALIESDRGRLKLAELALTTARKLDEKDPGIVNNLGLLAAKRDDVATARARFQEATAIDPGFAPAWANLGALALRYRDYPSAADAYSKAAAIDPSRTDLHLAYAWALEGLKKPKEARGQYEAVLAARPGDQDALYGRAAALKAEGNLPEAMKAFQAYAASSGAPKIKEAQSQIAQIDMRLKSAQPVAKAEPQKREAAKGQADLSALPIGKEDPNSSEPAPPLPDISDEPDVPATVVPAEKQAEPAKSDKPAEAPPAAKDDKAKGDEKGEAERPSAPTAARAQAVR